MATRHIARKQRTNADYLILGGGIAGIAALAETRRRGISALCLEAEAKPGGRIRTVRNRRLAGHPIEMGAEFVHGAAMKQLCESLGLTLIKHSSDGFAFVDGEYRPLLPILQAFKSLRDQAADYLAAGNEDRSVEEFIAALAEREKELPAGVTAHLLNQLIRNDFAARVSDLSLTGLLAPDVDGYEDNYRVQEGYDEVPKRLAAGGEELRFNHVVSAILRHRDRIDVVTNRGVYSGNVALVCLPVGVLQAGAVQFDPPLSRAKSIALDAINPGAATKLVIAFRRSRTGGIFWPADMPLLATSLATQLWWPTSWGFAEQRHFLASCLVGGAAVQRFSEREPRQVGLAQLAHMFGRERVEGKALATYLVRSWHEQPHTRGGYSSLPVGIDHAALLQELEAPEDADLPQLYFAGDYVTRHPGSVYSAYQSGIAAVERAARRKKI
jgi:monoamine oxidase